MSLIIRIFLESYEIVFYYQPGTVDVERTECTKQGKVLHHMLGKGKDC
jgi:hypothetical protein